MQKKGKNANRVTVRLGPKLAAQVKRFIGKSSVSEFIRQVIQAHVARYGSGSVG